MSPGPEAVDAAVGEPKRQQKKRTYVKVSSTQNPTNVDRNLEWALVKHTTSDHSNKPMGSHFKKCLPLKRMDVEWK